MHLILIISIVVLLLIIITFIFCSLKIAHDADEKKLE